MNEVNFTIYNIILLLGSMQGFLLCLLFVSSKRFQKTSTRFLVLLVLAISMTSLSNALNDMRPPHLSTLFFVCLSTWSLFIPFALYYFIHYIIQPDYSFTRKDYTIAFLSSLQVLQQIAWTAWYLISSQSVLDNLEIKYFLDRTTEIAGMLYCLWVIIASIKKLNNYDSNLKSQFAHINPNNIRWLKNSFIFTGILWLLWAVPLVYLTVMGDMSSWFFSPLELGLALVIYWLGYSVYFQKDLFEVKYSEELTQDNKKKTVELSDKTEEHYQKVLYFMQEEKLYQNPEFSMTMLAEKMSLSNGYLSQIINQKEGKNFFDFVNEYRIKEVKKMLHNTNYNHYSILGIALEAGFKSKSTFNAVFKKITGQTPSTFRKQLQNA